MTSTTPQAGPPTDPAVILDRICTELAESIQVGCCGNEAWRGRSCQYHQGLADGIDLAIDAVVAGAAQSIKLGPIIASLKGVFDATTPGDQT